MTKNKKAVLIAGAGESLGAAIARRFAREGYIACLSRRNGDKLAPLVNQIEKDGGVAHPFGCDMRLEEDVEKLFNDIEANIAPLAAVIFNPGANVNFPITETTARVYRKVWEMACFAGFLTGRAAARVMTPRKEGTILFTGATASVRGGTGYAAFAGAKFALRALAQSMAREMGPKGIHVAHIVIDGAIDTPWIQSNFPQIYKRKEQDGILRPDHIAENYWRLHQQPRTAWSHEIDLRPWMETW